MYKKKKSRLPLIIIILFLILAAAGTGIYVYQMKEKETVADNSEEEIVLEDNQELQYASIVSILGNEMTVTTTDGDEQNWLILVGTEVVTKLGTTTTFSRLANGDNIKMLIQTDDGNDVILKIWITDGMMPGSENGEMPQMHQGQDGEMPQMPEGQNGEMPQMPQGQNGEMPQQGGESSGT